MSFYTSKLQTIIQICCFYFPAQSIYPAIGSNFQNLHYPTMYIADSNTSSSKSYFLTSRMKILLTEWPWCNWNYVSNTIADKFTYYISQAENVAYISSKLLETSGSHYICECYLQNSDFFPIQRSSGLPRVLTVSQKQAYVMAYQREYNICMDIAPKWSISHEWKHLGDCLNCLLATLLAWTAK